MTELAQELMTPDEAAKWFRRSISWLRQQKDLIHIGGPGGQPLYHIRVCRAYVLGRMQQLDGPPLRDMQIAALAQACGLERQLAAQMAAAEPRAPQPALAS
jgi:hypothetical protein